jgi:hypothetical protein
VYAGSAEPLAARAFLRALVAPDARDAWTAAGFEPLGPRP